MRYPIWKKDDFFSFSFNDESRLDMDPHHVEFSDNLPVAYGFDTGRKSIGKVTDIRLEEGEITGELEFFDSTHEVVMQEGFRLAGWYVGVVKSADGKWVLAATLKSVSVVPESTMPGYPKKEVNDG